MTIIDLHVMCANIGDKTNIRIMDEDYQIIYNGPYYRIPLHLKTRRVTSFDFDNDLSGCIINTLPEVE